MKKKIVILGFTRQEYALIMLALRNVLTRVNSDQQDVALSLIDRMCSKIDCFVDSEDFIRRVSHAKKKKTINSSRKRIP